MANHSALIWEDRARKAEAMLRFDRDDMDEFGRLLEDLEVESPQDARLKVDAIQRTISAYRRIVNLCDCRDWRGTEYYSARVLIVEGGDVSQVFEGKTPLECVEACDKAVRSI
jgi:hypothetical protein